jgi:hypothetical protein
VFTRALQWSLSWARSTQSTPSHPTSLRSILILSTHLRLGEWESILIEFNLKQKGIGWWSLLIPNTWLHSLIPVSVYIIHTNTHTHTHTHTLNMYRYISQLHNWWLFPFARGSYANCYTIERC